MWSSNQPDDACPVLQAISWMGPAFNALFQSYDPDQNNMLGKPEYMAMMCFLRGATQTFQSFDFNRSGSVSLNWSQWVYAAANTV